MESGRKSTRQSLTATVQATLAAARRAWGLQLHRQSRAAAWQQLSKSMSKSVASSVPNASLPITEFRPSFVLTEDGSRKRDYQLLALRTHSLAPPTLGLTEGVFRGTSKKRGIPKLCSMAIPAELCVSLHICLLQQSNASGGMMWNATCSSPSLAVDPHSISDTGPVILFEIPKNMAKFSSDPFSLQAPSKVFSKKTMQALPSCFSRLFCFQRRQAPTKKYIKLSGLHKMMVFQSPDCTVVEGHNSDHESEK